MRTAVGSDEQSELTVALVAELEGRGHEVVAFGPVAGGQEESDWPLVCSRVASRSSRRGGGRHRVLLDGHRG